MQQTMPRTCSTLDWFGVLHYCIDNL
jgi:hypothetical protein